MTQLWLDFESWWPCKPTGGLPDVVHLVKYACQESRSHFHASAKFLLKKHNFHLSALWGLKKCNRVRSKVFFSTLQVISFLMSPKHHCFVKKWLRKTNSKMPTPLKKRKIHEICACLHIWQFCFEYSVVFMKSPKNLNDFFLNGPYLVSP